MKNIKLIRLQYSTVLNIFIITMQYKKLIYHIYHYVLSYMKLDYMKFVNNIKTNKPRIPKFN